MYSLIAGGVGVVVATVLVWFASHRGGLCLVAFVGLSAALVAGLYAYSYQQAGERQHVVRTEMTESSRIAPDIRDVELAAGKYSLYVQGSRGPRRRIVAMDDTEVVFDPDATPRLEEWVKVMADDPDCEPSPWLLPVERGERTVFSHYRLVVPDKIWVIVR